MVPKFAGDIPLWVGLILGVIAAAAVWALYAWELGRRQMAWRFSIMPLLRSVAVFVIVLTLTGPVLSEERDVPQRSRVLVFTDGSSSMGTDDRYASADQKIMVAYEHQWLEKGALDLTLLQLADDLRRLRESTGIGRRAGSSATALHDGCAAFSNECAEILSRVRGMSLSKIVGPGAAPGEQSLETFGARFEAQVASPAAELAAKTVDKASQIPIRARLNILTQLSADFEKQLRDAFRQQVQNASSNRQVAEALAKFDSATRWKRAESLLLGPTSGLVRNLSKHHEVELYVLRGGGENAWNSTAEATLPENLPGDPTGAATDLSTAIDMHVSRTLASTEASTAVVLVSDGRNNEGPSPSVFAKTLGVRNVPVYCIGIGDTQRRPDVAIVGARYNGVAFQDDRVQGTLFIQDDMPAGRPLPVRIEHNGEVLWQKELTTEGSGIRRVAFELSVKAAAEMKVAAAGGGVQETSIPIWMKGQIGTVSGEDRADNNERALCVVKAAPREARILIVDRPRWEARYVRNLFGRDPRWKANAVFTSNDGELRIGEGAGLFPSTREHLFSHDLIVLGDVKPSAFKDDQLVWLRDFVQKRGGGVIMVDGQRHALRALADRIPSGQTSAPIRELLPVSFESAMGISKPGQFQLTDQGASQSFLMLASGIEANMNAWRLLDGPHWSAAARPLPGSETLIELVNKGERNPALVWKRFGAGIVIYSAFDESWRFRRELADEYHQRYWNQLANAAMERPFAYADAVVSMDLSSLVLESGEAANARVRLRQADGTAQQGKASIVIYRENKQVAEIPLHGDANAGLLVASLPGQEPGRYTMGIHVEGIDSEKLKGRLEFEVLRAQTPEVLNLAANPQLLEEMSANSGGKYLAEENAHLLAGLLKPMSVKRVVVSEKKLWQSFWWFGPIVGLLALEMLFRKRAGVL